MQPILHRCFYVITFLVLMISACRKANTENIENYLHVDGTQPEVVKQLAEHLRTQERIQPFLANLLKTHGHILWSKSEIQNETNELTILVPLVVDNERFVNSFLLYRGNDKEKIFKFIRGRTYDSYGFESGPRITANTVVSDLIRLNHIVFGDTLCGR